MGNEFLDTTIDGYKEEKKNPKLICIIIIEIFILEEVVALRE